MRIATLILHYQRIDLTTHLIAQLRGVQDIFVFDDGSSVPFGLHGRNFDEDRVLMKTLATNRRWYLTALSQGLGITHSGNLMRSSENRGYVKSVNSAMLSLRQQGFEAVWTLNNDIERATAETLAGLTFGLESNVQIAAISPAVEPSAHPEMRTAPRPVVRPERFIDWVCPLVRMSAWADVGDFDEALPGYGCDLDWCKRARDRRWQFAVMPRMIIKHEGSATARSEGKTDHCDLGLMNTILCEKWGVKKWEDLKG